MKFRERMFDGRHGMTMDYTGLSTVQLNHTKGIGKTYNFKNLCVITLIKRRGANFQYSIV